MISYRSFQSFETSAQTRAVHYLVWFYLYDIPSGSGITPELKYNLQKPRLNEPQWCGPQKKLFGLGLVRGLALSWFELYAIVCPNLSHFFWDNHDKPWIWECPGNYRISEKPISIFCWRMLVHMCLVYLGCPSILGSSPRLLGSTSRFFWCLHVTTVECFFFSHQHCLFCSTDDQHFSIKVPMIFRINRVNFLIYHRFTIESP